MKTKSKRLLSILLAVLMAVTGVMPAFSAFAEDGEGGIIGVYELQIFYENGVIVPDFDDEEGKVTHIEHMKEGSVANTCQITTISKMRIKRPLKKDDPLYGLRLSTEDMELINQQFSRLFLFPK